MRYFEDQTDVDEWLDPLDYEGFWQEVSTFDIVIPSREACDADITDGVVDEAMALRVLKGFARLEVVRQQKLPPRHIEPFMSLTLH